MKEPKFKFIHCSDIHLNDLYYMNDINQENDSKNKIKSFKTFDKLISDAIAFDVDFILISGDLINKNIYSLKAKKHIIEKFDHLKQFNINVYIIGGQIDESKEVFWKEFNIPENVNYFSNSRTQVFPFIKKDKVVANIFGISFNDSNPKENLSYMFTNKSNETFSIGMMYANIMEINENFKINPVSIDDLKNNTINYWAIGSEHTNNILNADPYIVSSGSLSAHSLDDLGEKGYYLVEVKGKRILNIDFHPISNIIYENLDIHINKLKNIEELKKVIDSNINNLINKYQNKYIFLNIILKGKGYLHKHLNEQNVEKLFFEYKNLTKYSNSIINLINIENETFPDLDFEMRKKTDDFISRTIKIYENNKQNSKNYILKNIQHENSYKKIEKYLNYIKDDEFDKIYEKSLIKAFDYLGGEEY
ncbi:metallophosphoesterase [Oceanotoga sp. DSM 15011]|uniref:metallophosphoesterase family protein n=1 Tax=Oceanotoga sp. DSM 15011 TaxID=2984951 RepID=UPI0021F402E2|nr:metallophosphoesterase [Oceanotoga sp. DSM 15011]UYP00368.1 metallophosphoesterase [Oceanotoga sp. DSM 15011]